LSQCGYFANKGGRFFAILCGRPLRTFPYRNNKNTFYNIIVIANKENKTKIINT